MTKRTPCWKCCCFAAELSGLCWLCAHDRAAHQGESGRCRCSAAEVYPSTVRAEIDRSTAFVVVFRPGGGGELVFRPLDGELVTVDPFGGSPDPTV